MHAPSSPNVSKISIQSPSRVIATHDLFHIFDWLAAVATAPVSRAGYRFPAAPKKR